MKIQEDSKRRNALKLLKKWERELEMKNGTNKELLKNLIEQGVMRKFYDKS